MAQDGGMSQLPPTATICLVNAISPSGYPVSYPVSDANMAVLVAEAFSSQGYRIVNITSADGKIYDQKDFVQLVEDSKA